MSICVRKAWIRMLVEPLSSTGTLGTRGTLFPCGEGGGGNRLSHTSYRDWMSSFGAARAWHSEQHEGPGTKGVPDLNLMSTEI